jgi:hypothetical protein
MLLRIDDHMYVSNLQERFNDCFPYLKLEFYNTRNKGQGTSKADSLVDLKTLVSSIRTKYGPGLMDIKSWNKTGEVEQNFKNIYGLDVQLFYLRGADWIQASREDELTLQQLLDKAKSSLPPKKVIATGDEALELY